MPLRDVVLTITVFGLLPWIMRKPYIGILTWSWLGYMNPHRLTWSFAYNLPFSQVVALATLVGLLTSKEPKRLPLTPLTVTWIVFILWMGITTLAALDVQAASYQLEKVYKIQLVTFLTLMVMGSKERLNMLLWVIVGSIGYYGVKGGLFTLRTGGEHRVWGPAGSFIADNNALALALLMILPLMNYLRVISENKWIHRGLLAGMFLVGICIVGSYSRGAYLAIFCVAFFLWLKNRNKAVTGMAILLTLPLFFVFMPEQWHERMASIQDWENDASAMGRINAWVMTINVAMDRITGGGFNIWNPAVYAVYMPGVKAKAAHSIYFSILGEHGWIGLVLFLTIGIMTWRTGSWIIRHSRGHEALFWAAELARMIQVSLVAYASGGAFLSLSYFDLYWHLVAIMVLTRVLVQRHLEEIGDPAVTRPLLAGINRPVPDAAQGRIIEK